MLQLASHLKDIYNPQDFIKYMLVKHHTNSMSHLSVVAASLHVQYLLCAKKLLDKLKPHLSGMLQLDSSSEDVQLHYLHWSSPQVLQVHHDY
jgi:hypothetical protein